MNQDVLRRFSNDNIVISFVLIVILLFFTSLYISVLLGVGVLIAFASGCFLTITVLDHKPKLNEFLTKTRERLGFSEESFNGVDRDISDECDICGITFCPRHRLTTDLNKEPWRLIGLVDKNLDAAVESFYSQIIKSFVNSWFSTLSNDEDFICYLKQNLREATCQMVVKVKKLNAPALITEKLLPLFYDHYEILNKMLLIDHIPMNKLATTFVQNEYSIHPAVYNRQTEINYLRGIAKYLIPKLFSNENFNSNIFFNLIQELIACWVLLPLMDVLSDPNLINLLVIVATDPSKDLNAERKRMKIPLYNDRVTFLENFAKRGSENYDYMVGNMENDILKDQTKLYSFMQFLKKEGAVEILRFYLDVDHLNKELQDPDLEPQKLSQLYQQSEKLLDSYQKMTDTKTNSLTEAFEDARNRLQGKWRAAFYKTSNYFQLVYGSREIKKIVDNFNVDTKDPQPLQRLSTKLKGAMKMSAVDGAPLEEMPTVWDALTDQTQTDSKNIYSSVTSKLRKEKGQSLDSFMSTFMHSIEQSPDMGEDVMYMNNDETENQRPSPPDNNWVFGNLFELKRTSYSMPTPKIVASNNVKGPSQCLIYFLVKILNAPLVLVRFVLALCSVCKRTVDLIICTVIFKLIKIGLKERRLAFLIRLLEEHLFIDDTPKPTTEELEIRKQEARNRLEGLRKGLGHLFDIFQSPVLNKHLMYCLLDIIIGDLYPDAVDFN
uniref:CSON003419 protein n=1 Tax=Culicoides sonorensis TaxID=179676 RepID=A0A336MLP9_CULSO